MELQIQDLVSSIKKDGIEAANREAESIIAAANEKAEGIIEAAKREATSTKETAEKEIALLRESALVSAEQAKRDAMLAFKGEVQKEFERLLSAKVRESLTDASLAKLIIAVLSDKNVADYVAEVADVSDALKGELVSELSKGLEIKVSKAVKAGFRLAAKDGSGYFDCSDEEIMQMLMPYFRDIEL